MFRHKRYFTLYFNIFLIGFNSLQAVCFRPPMSHSFYLLSSCFAIGHETSFVKEGLWLDLCPVIQVRYYGLLVGFDV
jgi:hypothetical protein